MLERSLGKIQSAQVLSDVCVLGSGALAGTSFNLDQKKIAKELGLSQISRNSYDVSGDRDFVLSLLSGIVFAGLQLSRISEDLMIGQTKGNSLFDIDESLCTGSSMMPQKKNADFVELARGASSTFVANFVGMATLVKALPTSYNRDLQWDKRFLFDSVERLEAILPIFTKLIRTLTIREDRAKALLEDESLYATDLADYLVRRGLAFKKAHQTVGQIVSFAEENNIAISKIGLDLLRGFEPKIDADVYELFNAEHSATLKRTQGSTHPAEVKQQISAWKKKLK
jgi:argininosuccinate lyase